MIRHDYPQGSPEWLAARAGVITASRYKDACDRLKSGAMSKAATAYAAEVAVERIAGMPLGPDFQSWQMRAGQDQEPAAREAYELHSGELVEPAGLLTTDDGVFGYSPDGLVGVAGLVEVKTLLSASQIVKCIAEGDISDYRHQCLGGLWLTSRQWIDLVLWAPALAPIGRQLTVIRITADEARDEIDTLAQQLAEFASLVDQHERALRGPDTQELFADDPAAQLQTEQTEAQRAAALREQLTGAAQVPADERAAFERQQAEAAAAEQQRVKDDQDADDARRRALWLAEQAQVAPTSIPMQPVPAAADEPATLKLGDINARLAPISMSAAGLAALGIQHGATDKAAKLYRESDWPLICAALISHLQRVAA